MTLPVLIEYDVMTIADFRRNVEMGAYTDDDGSGFYFSQDCWRYNPQDFVRCSQLNEAPTWATHIVWFNK